MSDLASLLPPNATRSERALELAAARVGRVSIPDALNSRPETAALDHLPFLAWGVSADIWDADWSEAIKREVVARSAQIHRRKGTVGSVRQALSAAGYEDAVLEEFVDAPLIGASGGWGIGSDFEIGFWPSSWADYRVTVSKPITRAQVEVLRDLLRDVAPVRSRLADVRADLFFTVGDGLWAVGADIAIGGFYPLVN